MSAHIIAEFTVKDPDVYREKYASNAGKTAKEYEVKALANSNWELLHGDGSLTSGALMRFPDRESALSWYNSPEYQQLIEVRGDAMDVRSACSTDSRVNRGVPPIRIATPSRVVNMTALIESRGKPITDWSYPGKYKQIQAHADAKLLALMYTSRPKLAAMRARALRSTQSARARSKPLSAARPAGRSN